jgi:hypothetical protein
MHPSDPEKEEKNSTNGLNQLELVTLNVFLGISKLMVEMRSPLLGIQFVGFRVQTCITDQSSDPLPTKCLGNIAWLI